MTRLREAADRIGGPAAVSWFAFWATFLITGFGNLVTTPSMPFNARIVAIVGGQAVLWSVLLAMRVVALGDPSRPRPGVVFIGFAVATVARAVFVALWTGAVLGPDAANLPLRVASALTNHVPLLVICALVVSAFSERRMHIAELAALRDELAHSVEATRASVVERNDEAVARVRAVIADGLGDLDSQDADQSVQVLQRLAADVVRPLSHELASGTRVHVAELPEAVAADLDWSQVFSTLAVERPFRPLTTTLLLAFAAGIGLATLPLGAVVGVASLGFVTGLLALANIVLARPMRRVAERWPVAAVVGAALVVALLCGVFVDAISGDEAGSAAFTVTAVVFAAVFSLTTAFASAVLRDRDRMIVELAASLLTLRLAIARMRLVEWFGQRALSRALHGPVQTAVAAAAIRLDDARRDGHVDPQVIEQVRADLLAGLELLADPANDVTTLDVGIARMQAAWDGIAAITVSTSAAAAMVLATDDPLRAVVLDIVTEAVSNAVRHSAATRASVVIDVNEAGDDAGTLGVELRSDAHPDEPTLVSAVQAPGLGTRVLVECSLEWTRTETPDGYVVRVLLPVGGPTTSAETR